jgi:phosphatidylglycerophosphate synthase
VDLAAGGALAPAPAAGRAVLLDGSFLHHPDLLAHALTAAEVPFAYVDECGWLCGLGVVGLDSGVGPDTLAAQPRVQLPEGCFAQPAADPVQARQAERRLFRSFIKQTDGWFSQHLNRPVSLWITRRIVHLPVHPNAVTAFCLLLGALSGWSAAQGTPAGLAAGGVLFQIASILDGVDGEIARARLLQSKTGEWLDTVCDDATNALFIAGVTLGVHRATLDLFWLLLGGSSLVVYGVTLLIMYGGLIINRRKATLLAFQEEIRRPGYRPGRVKAWLVALQPFIKRDFYGYAFMVSALLGLPKIIIAGWSVGAFLTLGFIGSEVKTLFSGSTPGKSRLKQRSS